MVPERIDSRFAIASFCGSTASNLGGDQHFARLDHFAADQGLQPVEIELAVGVAVRRPAFEQRIDLPVELVVAARGARHDARANDVVDQHRHGLGRMRVVAHEIAHPVAQERPSHADLGVRRGSRRAPALCPPSARGPVVTARRVSNA
jgi:hypothetical protein